MKVKIKKLNPDARIPEKAHKEDFCYDCWAVSEEEIAPNVGKYGLGFALQPEVNTSYFINSDEDINHLVISIDIRPRSSVWKTGMVLANCEGTVDSIYRGEVCVIFYHVFPNMPRYRVGDKICQIKLGDAEIIDFAEVDELDDTERGTGGFGSTGS